MFNRLKPDVYWFNAKNKSTCPVSLQTVPWTVIWLLSRYHKKHIFVNNQLPKPNAQREAMKTNFHRMSWRLFFFNKPKSDRQLPIKFKRFRPIVPFSKPLDMHLRAWQDIFLNRIMSDLRLSKASRVQFSNTPKFVALAFACLREQQLAVMPTDKDQGFALCTSEDLIYVHDSTVCQKHYCPVPLSEINIQKITIKLMWLCKQIDKNEMGDGEVFRQLTSSVSPGLPGIVSQLKTTCKTHKPQGKVWVRNLHCSVGHPFSALGAWLNYRINLQIGCLPHLLKDSGQLVDAISHQQIPKHVFLFRIDVAEFFMSGSSSQLINSIVPHFPQSERTLIQEALNLILENQFIQSKISSDQSVVHQCVVGAGMGMVCSGAVADMAFLSLIEIPFAMKFSQQKQYGVSNYYRFKDDIFFSAETKEGGLEFYSQMCKRQGFFSLELEDVSSTSVKMLDLRISVDNKLQRLVASANFKPTGLCRPLTSESRHHPSVQSWPISRLHRLNTLCTTTIDADKSMSVFIKRFRTYFESPSFVQELDSQKHQILISRVIKQMKRAGTFWSKSDPFWMVLPYHPAIHLHRYDRTRKVMKSPLYKHLLRRAFRCTRVPFEIRYAWKNQHKHLVNRVTTTQIRGRQVGVRGGELEP